MCRVFVARLEQVPRKNLHTDENERVAAMSKAEDWDRKREFDEWFKDMFEPVRKVNKLEISEEDEKFLKDCGVRIDCEK